MGAGAVAFIHGDGIWEDGSVLTNPSDATTLADSGVLNGSNYLVGTAVWASVDFVYDLKVLNSGLSTVYVQRRAVQAGGNDDFNLPNKVVVPQGGRIRISSVGGITGQVQGSLFVMEVA